MTVTSAVSDTVVDPSEPDGSPGMLPGLGRRLGPRNIGAVYVWVVLAGLFAIWKPDLFLTTGTAARIFNESAIAGLMALALIIPLAAGLFDLSIGSVMGLSGVLVAKLVGSEHQTVLVAIVLAVLVAAALGAVNAFVVVVLGVDSFIGTLATGSMVAAATVAVSKQQILIEGIHGHLSPISTRGVGLIQLPVFYVAILALVLSLVLARTVIGRQFYAVGFNRDAARLAGIPTGRVRCIAMVTSATIAGLAGVVLTARIEAADPGAGPSYLIPAFCAAFLGATQFGKGRFNPWGAMVAVFMLGTGTVGLLLAGAPQWAPQMFQGAVLLVAVGMTQGRRARSS
jgi:ribose transport system permease protein